MKRVSFTTESSELASPLAVATPEAENQERKRNIPEQETAKTTTGSTLENQEITPDSTFITCNENTHCLVVEEEHDMSQYLTNYGYRCYRLTHRNADSGAANGLLTKIKNREFCVLMIHMPV